MHLYHGSTSVCSAKVRVGLAELGHEWTGQILDLGKSEQNADWYLKLNPKGVVPTLVEDDLIIVESSVILEYLAEQRPSSLLIPTDPAVRVRAKMWLTDCIDIHSAINTLTFSTTKRRQILAKKSAEQIDASIAKMANPANAAKRRDLITNGVDSTHVTAAFFTLKLMFDRMQSALETSQWLLGDTYTIADVAILAYIDRLDRLGLAGLWTKRTPKVQDWLDSARQRNSYAIAIEAFAGSVSADHDKNMGTENWAMVSPKWAAFLKNA